MTDSKPVDKYYKPWWSNEKLSKEWKEAYQATLIEYLTANEYEPEDLKPDTDTCKKLIPYLGYKIPEWQMFNETFFLVNDYKAHKSFYNCIVNKLDSLIKEKA